MLLNYLNHNLFKASTYWLPCHISSARCHKLVRTSRLGKCILARHLLLELETDKTLLNKPLWLMMRVCIGLLIALAAAKSLYPSMLWTKPLLLRPCSGSSLLSYIEVGPRLELSIILGLKQSKVVEGMSEYQYFLKIHKHSKSNLLNPPREA